MRQWQLHIDESGRFSPGEDDGDVVAGLLSVLDSSPLHHKALRSELERAAPMVPWPLHARTMNRPSAYVVWARVCGHAPPGTERLLARAASHLETLEPKAWKRALAAVGRGREPDSESLEALDEALERANRPLHRALRNEVQARVQAQVDQVVLEAVGSSGAMWTLAAEAEPLDALGLHEDRYLALLGQLVIRASHLMAWTLGEGQVLRVMPLGRCLAPIAQGRRLQAPIAQGRRLQAPWGARGPYLSVGHLEELGGRIGEYLAPGVELELGRPGAYDGKVRAAFVVADLLANRARRAMRRRRTSLSQLEERLAKYGGVGHPEDLPPGATSSGAPWTDLRTVRGGTARPRTLEFGAPGARPWASEQAIQWAFEAWPDEEEEP